MAKASRRSNRSRTPAEREAVDHSRHAPVSLPSGGSFEVHDLQKGLDKAVDKHDSNRDAEVRKAIESSQHESTTNTTAPNAIPGHKVVKTETQLAAGSTVGEGKDAEQVGQVVVTEYRQVFDAKAAEDAADNGSTVAPVGGQPVSGQSSEILSSEDVDAAPPPPVEPTSPETDEDSSDAGDNSGTGDTTGDQG